MGDKIDAELLIGLVRAHPALWDKSLEQHKDFVQRSAAWRDVCKVLCPDYETLNRKDKHMYVKTVVKKWTNVRDAWRKSIAESRYKKKLKPYLYHEQLKFLLKNLNYKIKRDDDDASEHSHSHEAPRERASLADSDDASDGLLPGEDFGARVVRRRRGGELPMPDAEVSMFHVGGMAGMGGMAGVGGVEDNPHLCFARSLLPVLSKLSDDETLEFQLGVIKLLQDTRRRANALGAATSCSLLTDVSVKEEVDD